MKGVGYQNASVVFNKYKYNGIEQNEDSGLNQYDAFYRNLDPQIGRFWQSDLVTTHHETPYATMQNNPIMKMDWLGDYFTWANSTLEDTYHRMRKRNNELMNGYLSELNHLDWNDKASADRADQLATLINAHSDLNTQWDEMDQSDVEFHVSSDMPTKGGAGGETDFCTTDMRVNVKLGIHQKDIGTMAHEFRHGYGYLNGELVGRNNDVYDQMDEVEAYKAGFLFTTKDAIKMVAKDQVGEWFKTTQVKTDLYKGLAGREVQLTLNTPAAEFLKYNLDSRIGRVLNSKNNANMTSVKDAIDFLNKRSQGVHNKNEIFYDNLLKNRNKR